MFVTPSLLSLCQKIIFFYFFEIGLTSLPPFWTMSLNILFFFWGVPLTECIVDYAVLLSPLEKAVAGLESAEKVQWTPELSNQFNNAKEALNNVDTIYIPKPTDKLEIYVDYSQDKKAMVSLACSQSVNESASRNFLRQLSCHIIKLRL